MIKKYRLVIMILLVSSGVFAQLATIKLYNVRVDNVSIPNGSPIEMGTRTEVNIKCVVQFTKPSNISLTVNSGIKNYNGQQLTTIATDNLPGDGYNIGFTENREFTILARDYPCNGSGYFYAGAQSAQGNIQSVNVFVKRTPIYSITQSQSNITCGLLTNVTFTANSSCSSSYNWTYGTGWTYISGGSDSITLKPNVLSPGSVELRPTFQGVLQPSVSTSLGFAPFTTTAIISGADKFCTPTTSSVYTIANVGAGNTVSWSSSNTAIATISNATQTSATLNKVGFGNVRIIATITNSCGQPGGVSQQVQILDPVVINPANFIYAPQVNEQWCDLKWHYVEILFPYQDGVTANFLSVTPNLGTLVSQNQGGIIYKFGRGFAGQFSYVINFYNGCEGIEYAAEDFPPIMIKTCRQIGQRQVNTISSEYNVFPNPSKDIVSIELINQEIDSKNNDKIEALLYDKMGQITNKIEIINNSATFSVRDLTKGIYFLKIDNNGKIETHQVSVE